MSEDQKHQSKILYADGISKIRINPFMSKITLDVEDINESVTLVLPTAALLNLARNLIVSFSNPEIDDSFNKTHEDIKQNLVEIRKK